MIAVGVENYCLNESNKGAQIGTSQGSCGQLRRSDNGGTVAVAAESGKWQART